MPSLVRGPTSGLDSRMSTKLITEGVWNSLRRVAKTSHRPNWVAVAYFGQGADKLLRLTPGSRLVVNASLSTVRAGQTHPASLLRLVRRGIRVYSVENLHAKVYVIGNRAFIGSANASQSSAQRLLEAIVSTTEQRVVKRAREFIGSLCMEALSPQALASLQKSYRPPRSEFARFARRERRQSPRAKTSALRLVQLSLIEWPEDEEDVHESGLVTARSRREHRAGWEIQSFRLTGGTRIARRDLVMQAVDEGRSEQFVEPPGKVLNVVRRRVRRGRRVAYVYVEVPKVTRRPSLSRLAGTLGRGARKRLMRDGLVRDEVFAQQILRYWAQRR